MAKVPEMNAARKIRPGDDGRGFICNDINPTDANRKNTAVSASARERPRTAAQNDASRTLGSPKFFGVLAMVSPGPKRDCAALWSRQFRSPQIVQMNYAFQVAVLAYHSERSDLALLHDSKRGGREFLRGNRLRIVGHALT